MTLKFDEPSGWHRRSSLSNVKTKKPRHHETRFPKGNGFQIRSFAMKCPPLDMDVSTVGDFQARLPIFIQGKHHKGGNSTMPVKIKRVYDERDNADGLRILVDRLWPRGLSKDKARFDLWIKDVAPSSELRKWFAHREDRWEDFQRRYRAELMENAALDELCAKSEKHAVTLLYAARDECINHARVLAAVIAERSRRRVEADRWDEGAVEMSSPPCFLHELDPAWLGTKRRDGSGETADREGDQQPSHKKTDHTE